MYQRSSHAREALSLFKEDFSNIQLAHSWAEQHAGQIGYAAYLCVVFPLVGSFILDKHQHPLERIRWLECSLEHLNLVPGFVSESVILSLLGRAHIAIGQTREAIAFFQQSLNKSRATGERDAELSALSNLGVAHFYLGETSLALESEEQALSISQELDNRGAEAQITGDLGNVYFLEGDYQRATEMYELELRIAREINDKQCEKGALLSLGLIAHLVHGKRSEAVEYYQDALAITRELGDSHTEGILLGNLSNVYGVWGETEKASEISDQRIAIARELGDRRGEGKALYNRALFEREFGENERAITLGESALKILEPTCDAYITKMRQEVDGWRDGPVKPVSSISPELDYRINRRLQLSAEYQVALDQWKALPWWRRLFTKRPELPSELLEAKSNDGV